MSIEVSGGLSSELLAMLDRVEYKHKRRGGAKPGERKYQIKELRATHHEVLRLAVLGVNNTEIAEIVGMTPAMISNILGSEVAKRQIEIMQGNRSADALAVREQIANLAPLAVETLQTIMQDPNASDRNKISAAVDVLDRGGYAAPKVIQGQFLTAHLTAEDIANIKKRAQSVGAVSIEAKEI